jgi:phage tail-like protein
VEATIGGAAETPARAAPEPAAPVVPVASITSADVERAQSRVSLPPPAPPPPPRATFPAPEPPGPLSEYLRDLPIIFQDGEFLGRFLLIFESIWEPLEHRQDHIEMYFDPATCAPSFLPWLASWLDPGLDTRWPEERLRAIVARVMDLYRWRGTRYGLGRMIELATGLTPRISEDPATPFCFRVRLEIPADGGVDQRLVENLIESHKPAHAGYVLELVPQP